MKCIYPIHPTFLQYYQQVVEIALVNTEYNEYVDEETVQECIDEIVSKKFITADIVGLGPEGKLLVELSVNSDSTDHANNYILSDVLSDMHFVKKSAN